MGWFDSAEDLFAAAAEGRVGPGVGFEFTVPEGATQQEFDAAVYEFTGDSGGRPGPIIASATPVAFNPLEAGYNPRAIRQPYDAARESLIPRSPAPAPGLQATSYLVPVLVFTALVGGAAWWYSRSRR